MSEGFRSGARAPRRALLAAVLAASALHCGLNKFDTTVADEVTIPGSATSGAPLSVNYDGSFKNLDLKASKDFASNGTDPSHVGAINVKTVHLESTTSAQNCLSCLIDSVALSVSSPGLPTVAIASQSPLPMGPSTDLTVDPSINLKPYATAESMRLSADIKLKTAPRIPATLKTTVTLSVTVTL